jgi:hypothetical protein
VNPNFRPAVERFFARSLAPDRETKSGSLFHVNPYDADAIEDHQAAMIDRHEMFHVNQLGRAAIG